MAQKVEFLTKDLALLQEPQDGELQQYFMAHQERYREPDELTFSHVFIDPDARGSSAHEDASVLLELLDFAPLLWTLDSHALWHLTTAPIHLVWYDFVIRDCAHLARQRDEYKRLA